VASHIVERALIQKTCEEKKGTKFKKNFERVPDDLMQIFENDSYSSKSAWILEDEWDAPFNKHLFCINVTEIQYAKEMEVPKPPPEEFQTMKITQWPPTTILPSTADDWPPKEVFDYHKQKAYSKYDYSNYLDTTNNLK